MKRDRSTGQKKITSDIYLSPHIQSFVFKKFFSPVYLWAQTDFPKIFGSLQKKIIGLNRKYNKRSSWQTWKKL